MMSSSSGAAAGRRERGRLPALYHFTCDHGHEGITKSRTILAHMHIFAPALGPLLWLTDLPTPSPESVGLTSNLSTCNRLAHRYRIQSRAAQPWAAIRHRAPREVVEILESFGQPEHWYVIRRALTPSEFAYDTTYAPT